MSALISWPQTSPSLAFESYTLKLMRHTTLMQSPFTGRRQTMAQPFALWSLSNAKFAKQDVNAGILRSFLAQLSGQANRFNFPIPDAQFPTSGYSGNSGLVNGAGQTGSYLVTDGWAATSLILADGDYFTVNGELKQAVGYSYSDGSGNTTIAFIPPLRSSPPDNLQLFIGNAKNLILQSSTFGSAWAKTNCSISVNTFTRTATGNCYVITSMIVPVAYNVPYTFSLNLKAGTLTGPINLFIQDGSGGHFQAQGFTPTSSYVRYSITGFLPPGSNLPLQCGINPVNTIGSPGDTLFIQNAQLEIGSGFTNYKNVTTGDGNPYCIMSSTTDDAASWDLSPPLVYDVQLDAMESFE